MYEKSKQENQMRKLSFFIVLFLILINFSGCKNQELMNQWKPNGLKIDGSDDDWQSVPLFMDEDMNIAFGSANDGENYRKRLCWFVTILYLGNYLIHFKYCFVICIWRWNDRNASV